MPAVSALPDRPNLEHLKAQAKALLAAYRAADPDALERVRPYFAPPATVGLNQAQLVVAREYGFESWAKLKIHVALRAADATSDLSARADRLAEVGSEHHGGMASAEAVRSLLATSPTLGAATLAAACVTGSAAAVGGFLDSDPALINAKIAPRGWEPLLYVCFSCLLSDDAARPGLLETARLLIDRGANVDATWPNAAFDNCPESCLYGATGVNNCPPLAEMLLRAGANPEDGESMYHATELPTWDCLELLMKYGGSIDSHNALAHLLDREEPAWLRLMLSYVKDPAKIPPVLPFALRRGRSAECCQILIESGMDINAPDPGQGSRTPYQVATRLGRTDVVALLEAAGADTTLSAADALIGRLALGESVPPSEISADMIAALDAEKPTPTLGVLAERGQDDALETLLAAGANPDVVDGNGWTGLHHAALQGRLSTVRVLLRHHADPTIRDLVHTGTPVGFGCHGSANNRNASPEDYVETVRSLLDAGAPLSDPAWGSPGVQALLVSRGAKPATP